MNDRLTANHARGELDRIKGLRNRVRAMTEVHSVDYGAFKYDANQWITNKRVATLK